MVQSSPPPSAPRHRISQHGLDIIFKLEAEQLGTALGRKFGIDLPPIVRHFPTELPVADVHLDQLDTIFELAESSLLHLECQTEHRRETLLRFLQYDVDLYTQYRRHIYTVVIYGAGIRTAAETLDFGTVHYRVHNVFLGCQDGEATYRQLKAKLAAGASLDSEERLDLVFLPLMRHKRSRPKVQVVTDALALARQLPEDAQRQVLASLIGLGQSFLGPEELGALLEGLMTTNIGEMLLDRGAERGAMTKARQDVLMVLSARFGAVPPELDALIGRINNLDRLDTLLSAAATANSLQEFMLRLN
ncbi:MAG: hypothetical protein M3Y74_13885 [Chloroflexota bacterium]|nr:hypothetical protein [Chloroflexota bacterium]